MTAKEIKARYACDPDARQLLIVECTEGSNALARYYIKKDGGWWLLHRCSAFIGKNGAGKTSEGDAKTPYGELRPLRAFGIKPDPGCSLPYLNVAPGTIACDSPGKWYNRIVTPSEYGFQNGASEPAGERMWTLSPEYHYGLETDYNRGCVYPLGSAIFIHCKGAKTWTGGCVALDKRVMRQILRTADAGLRIYVL